MSVPSLEVGQWRRHLTMDLIKGAMETVTTRLSWLTDGTPEQMAQVLYRSAVVRENSLPVVCRNGDTCTCRACLTLESSYRGIKEISLAKSRNMRAGKRISESVIQVVILTVGFAVSVCLGVVFYIKADTATALATFATILGGLLTLQIEATFRRNRDEQSRTERDRFMNLLEAKPWLYEFTTETARKVTDILGSYESPFALKVLQKVATNFLQELEDIRRGRTLVRRGSDHELVLWLTENLENSLLATNLYSAEHEHLGRAGSQEYKRLYRAAIERGVQVERIFIYSKWTPKAEESLTDQSKAGVRTYRLDAAKIRPELRVDMAIWDQRYGSELSFSARGDVIDSYIYFSEQDVIRMLERYNKIKALAEVWPNIVENTE